MARDHRIMPGRGGAKGRHGKASATLMGQRRGRQTRPAAPSRICVGITGSLASGKSTVLKAFAKAGFKTLSADDIVHEIYEERGLTRMNVLRRFPPTPAGFKRLEAWIHPLVMRKVRAFMARHAGRDAVAVEIPLLFEIGADDVFDQILFVFSPKAHRRRRALRRGMSLKLFEFLDAKQWPVARKKRLADAVLRNSGDKKALKKTARHWARALLTLCG